MTVSLRTSALSKRSRLFASEKYGKIVTNLKDCGLLRQDQYCIVIVYSSKKISFQILQSHVILFIFEEKYIISLVFLQISVLPMAGYCYNKLRKYYNKWLYFVDIKMEENSHNLVSSFDPSQARTCWSS